MAHSFTYRYHSHVSGHVSKHLLNRLRKAKKAVKDETEKPAIVKTHLRNAIIVPEMLASQLGVYTGLGYSLVEIKVMNWLRLRVIRTWCQSSHFMLLNRLSNSGSCTILAYSCRVPAREFSRLSSLRVVCLCSPT